MNPHDIWLYIKNFFASTDAEETNSFLWKQIFKDTSWLKYAVTFDQCSPVLIGYQLRAYRPKPSTRLYLALIANDHSGDLKYESKRFFAALQGKWEYDHNKYEVHFASGITLNVYDVINGYDTVEVPLEKIFTNTKKGVYSEYCYYENPIIRELRSSDITKWDPNYRTHPHAPPGWWNGPACKGRDIKNGCRLTLLDRGTKKGLCILPRSLKSKANMA